MNHQPGEQPKAFPRLSGAIEHGILAHLEYLYGTDTAQLWKDDFFRLFAMMKERIAASSNMIGSRTSSIGSSAGHPIPLDRHHTLLITYADTLQEEIPPVKGSLPKEDSERCSPRSPLSILAGFLDRWIGSLISTVHLLPFYPASSDDGFSVIDPLTVEPAAGTWDDIHRISESWLLMFDLVANHLSRSNQWIQAYTRGEADFRDFVIEMEGSEDLRGVFRPRALPLLSRIDTVDGQRLVWTTFSPDQIDLNYRSPKVLLTVIEMLLTYIVRGASLIRLDAIAFIWKELGTACLHHEKTHAIIKFMRWTLDQLAPGRGIITETNVPHSENISYFGDGSDEASMVYNFPLPPLVLHTFLSGDASILRKWAAGLEFPSPETTYFNFLASHDGIGVVPAKGLLSTEHIQALVDHVLAQGGYVSFRSEPDGSTSPYELNCSYLSALSGLEPDETLERRTDRFIAAQAIMLSLRGVPGIYIHSLLGSENCPTCPDLKSYPRRINREKLSINRLELELADPESLRSRVLRRYLQLLKIHRDEPAFRPSSHQLVLDCGQANLFALFRLPAGRSSSGESDGSANPGSCEDLGPSENRDPRPVLCLINVSGTMQRIPNLREGLHLADRSDRSSAMLHEYLFPGCLEWVDMAAAAGFCSIQPGNDAETTVTEDSILHFDAPLVLKPYQVMWLAPVTLPA